MVWRNIFHSQQGVALLVVLLVTSLATVLAVSLISSQQIEIRRTANVLDNGQAQWLALGVEDFAAQMLIRDKKDNNIDHLGEDWAFGLFPTEVEGGLVSGNLEDMQGRFNINNLAVQNEKFHEYSRKQFEQLLRICDLDVEIAQAVADWLDADIDPRFPAGAEDETYSGLEPAYRTGNQDMVSPSELMLVRGMTREGFQCLAPLVNTLPDASYVNVNTALPQVIVALAGEENMSLSEAEEFVENRSDEGYSSVNKFLKAAGLAGKGIPVEFLSVYSDYFLAYANVEIGNGKIRLNSLLHRKEGKVEIVRRTIGVI